MTRLGFNEANLLERITVNLQGRHENGQPVWTAFVADVDYDAKGQRTDTFFAFLSAHFGSRKRSSASLSGNARRGKASTWPA